MKPTFLLMILCRLKFGIGLGSKPAHGPGKPSDGPVGLGILDFSYMMSDRPACDVAWVVSCHIKGPYKHIKVDSRYGDTQELHVARVHRTTKLFGCRTAVGDCLITEFERNRDG